MAINSYNSATQVIYSQLLLPGKLYYTIFVLK